MQMTMSQTATPPPPIPTLPPRRPPTLPPRPMAAEPPPLPQVAENGVGRRLAAQAPPNMQLPLPVELQQAVAHYRRNPKTTEVMTAPPPPTPLHQDPPQRAPRARESRLWRPPPPPPPTPLHQDPPQRAPMARASRLRRRRRPPPPPLPPPNLTILTK